MHESLIVNAESIKASQITFVGDLHGCYRSFKALLEKIPQEDNVVVLLGDVINKGKRSYETYQFVRGQGFMQLLGNHDYYCVNRHNEHGQIPWLRQGGGSTVQSIRNHFENLGDSQLQIVLSEMAYYFRSALSYLIVETSFGKKLLATHGGISPKVYRQYYFNLPQVLNMDIRRSTSYLFNKMELVDLPGFIQVIGHQPTEKDRLFDGKNYHLDTGCVYNRRGMGWLTAGTFSLVEDRPPIITQQVNID
ncbi:metallophosphoesterase [Flammeovirgaceae bacterium SG7u.111]|nr:metallophosphoesterase [Flammeovirgaceae bacterium SG7u.132]WPO36471.1 metallophosphoesterase [Flammeovirgaceae bacterium SG7u.111]